MLKKKQVMDGNLYLLDLKHFGVLVDLKLHG